MKRFLTVTAVALSLCFRAQNPDSLIGQSASILKDLKPGDSITYYQCHVEEAVQQLSTVSGQTLTGSPQKYSITEKFVITRLPESFQVNYYTAALTVFPNRKFSGLKVREQGYWGFKKECSFTLTAQGAKVLLALERKGREAIEYDYVINKYNTNQLIIKLKKDFRQLVIEGDYVISKLIIE